MADKLGTLIKEARTGAKLTQEQLASRLDGISAADISKAERGEKALSQATLKQIAKITGVTQASLLNAAKASGSASTKKPASTKKTADKDSMNLTAAEKKLVELYRAADSDTKKAAVKLLKGEQEPGVADLLASLLGGKDGKTQTGDVLGSILSGAVDMLGKK